MAQTDCLFCKIAQGAIPSTKLYEDEHFFLIADINPQAQTHLLLITQEHYTNMLDEQLSSAAGQAVLTALPVTLKKLDEQYDFASSGMRLLQNNGVGAGQSVMHLHFHLLVDGKLPERLC